jgi:hypothetical protein
LCPHLCPAINLAPDANSLARYLPLYQIRTFVLGVLPLCQAPALAKGTHSCARCTPLCKESTFVLGISPIDRCLPLRQVPTLVKASAFLPGAMCKLSALVPGVYPCVKYPLLCQVSALATGVYSCTKYPPLCQVCALATGVYSCTKYPPLC